MGTVEFDGVKSGCFGTKRGRAESGYRLLDFFQSHFVRRTEKAEYVTGDGRRGEGQLFLLQQVTFPAAVMKL